MSYEEAHALVAAIVEEYELDPNFPESVMSMAVNFMEDQDLKNDPARYMRELQEIDKTHHFRACNPEWTGWGHLGFPDRKLLVK